MRFSEIQFAGETVVEFQPEYVIADVSHRRDANGFKRRSGRGHDAERTLGEPVGQVPERPGPRRHHRWQQPEPPRDPPRAVSDGLRAMKVY